MPIVRAFCYIVWSVQPTYKQSIKNGHFAQVFALSNHRGRFEQNDAKVLNAQKYTEL